MRLGRRTIRHACTAALALLAFAPTAFAHVERPSYWPDPAPDCSIKPCAGGEVPHARSLSSSLDRKLPGATRVVCQADSLTRLKQAVAQARANGYDVRPTDHRSLSRHAARQLLEINRSLLRRCRYHEIQPAVMASHNDDRVVIMPGLYTEPTARAQPTHDPKCKPYQVHSDSGDPGALSHEYQIHCPDDANLVAVIGRAQGPGKDPDPPLEDRHGIPNLGRCIRCNLQIEGSGVSADDVVIEAGDPKAGNGGPSAAGHAKDVGIFVDRADGFVLRKVTVRHATEHDIYVMETDGYLFDQFKTFYAGAYGVLTFVEDHGLMQNCEAAGNGDSGLYPGAGAKSSAGRDPKWYPVARYSQEIRDCDSHHNTGGYSGTNGNATHIDHNNFYDNALGFTTDVFTAPGHPGFPQQGDLVEDNNFYDNNFNPYVASSDVKPFIPVPVGTGFWIAGGNDNVLRRNRFYDNYRRGVMLFAAPDATICGPPPVGSKTPVPGCDPSKVSTSYRNSFTANLMGIAPDGATRPNGTDFWWDNFPGDTGNCWWGNIAAPGHSITTSPAALPDCNNGTDPSTSMGTGDPANEGELTGCLVGFTVGPYPQGEPYTCDWSTTPAAPGSTRARASAASGSAIADERRQEFEGLCAQLPQTRTCGAYTGAAPSFAPRAPGAPVRMEGAWARRALGLYTCADWRRATPSLRAKLLARLDRFTGGAVEGDGLTGYGSTLTGAQATALFDGRCAGRASSHFALYKLYGTAAAFAGS